MTDDYSCRSCNAAMYVPDGEDKRFCRHCAIEEIDRLREENTALRAAVQSAHERADHWTEQAAGFVGERDRLQAIVDRLPKTADGVPVVPGQFIYASDGKAVMMLRYAENDGRMAYPEVCYSTREAAVAAREGAGT
jgi:hypothetical protein